MKKTILLFFCTLVFTSGNAQPAMKFGLLKYRGGGDWYANPTSLTNLAEYCNKNLQTNIDPQYATVEVGSPEIFNFPFLHITGHGNIVFSDEEAQNLRNYLVAGGFLHIDDNYGMDPFVRTALEKVFPELELLELPFEHPIYHQQYEFKNGLPKIHEHDGKPAQGFGIFYKDRLVVFYTYECDLGDGWEDPDVHFDSPEIRQQALQMGANIIRFAFSQ